MKRYTSIIAIILSILFVLGGCKTADVPNNNKQQNIIQKDSEIAEENQDNLEEKEKIFNLHERASNFTGI